jgi:anti-sigma factor NepR-like protein
MLAVRHLAAAIGTILRALAFGQAMRAAGKATLTASQTPDAAERSGVRPKLGPHGRREIGRALESMYEDVVSQGVPPRIRELIEGLDARAGSLDSHTA